MDVLSCQQKALRINLDSKRYGTFAEIGAGQEVVRWFFQVGGASGTVAKSMSAYDMKVSDAVYGKAVRYVSRQRVMQMLDHEFELNVERLSDSGRCLFAFADTIAARGHSNQSGEFHGWMGIRFQEEPRAEPSQILVHIRMLDRETVSQQEALGYVGVNLIYGALYLLNEPFKLLDSLLDGISNLRILIDAIDFSGPAFRGVDNRLMALQLVKSGLTEVAMFAPDGQILQPSEVLHKRPILIERGSFRPVSLTHIDVLRSGRGAFERQLGSKALNSVSLMEITTRNLRDETDLDSADFLSRADLLTTVGQPVLISRMREYHRLISYLRRYTSEPLALALGAGALQEIFDPKYYIELEGGIVEGLGRLFRQGVTVFVYPMRRASQPPLTIDSFCPGPSLQKLYEHFKDQQSLVQLTDHNERAGLIESNEILRRIQSGDESWREYVPEPVAQMIEERKLFGYQPGLKEAERKGKAA